MTAKKKNIWELLNTPVQELFKEEPPTQDAVQVEEPPLAVEEVLPPVIEDTEPTPPVALPPEKEQEPTESDWLMAFKDKLQWGLGKEKPRLSQQEKTSWLKKFSDRLAQTRESFIGNIQRLAKGRTRVDDEMLEELEEILLQSDIGIETCDEILEHLQAEAKTRRFLPEEVLPSLTHYLKDALSSEAFIVEKGKLNIFLVVGVNGTGKTTTVGKIAAKLKISDFKVMLAAADTFRAAAIEQLEVWGQRANVPVIHHHEGADAGAVVYDAIQSAKAKKIDALLIDTAGRLHNKENLMAELKKVERIVRREGVDARIETLLVLDATTGQNGLRQAEVFSEAIPIDGIILTKLDGTAKGGVIFSIRKALSIPIKLIGIGEHLDDLQEFSADDFVAALFMESEKQEV